MNINLPLFRKDKAFNFTFFYSVHTPNAAFTAFSDLSFTYRREVGFLTELDACIALKSKKPFYLVDCNSAGHYLRTVECLGCMLLKTPSYPFQIKLLHPTGH